MTTTTFTSSVISDGGDPIFSYAADGDTLIVESGVTLSNRGDSAINARGGAGLFDLTAIIEGQVSAPYWAAFDAFGSSVAVTVGSAGRLESSGAMALEMSFDSSLSNAGALYASRGFGVVITDVTTASVTNTGTIFGEVGAVEFTDGRQGGTASLLNYGDLLGGSNRDNGVSGAGANHAVFSDTDVTDITNVGTIQTADRAGAGIMVNGGVLSLDNSGTIESSAYYGVMMRGAGRASIVNDGTISGLKGGLSLSGGDDSVLNRGLVEGRITLGAGNDVYRAEGGTAANAVWGQAGNDILSGGKGADILGGGTGQDTLRGGDGADVITGGAGADRLSGGAGDDLFRFGNASDATGDRIVSGDGAAAFQGAGTAGGDRIDLSAIDADIGLSGHQHLAFGTSHAVGHVWAEDVGDVTYIRANTGGVAGADFELAVLDGAGVGASAYASIDFIL